jgi:hypothetical protein
LIQLLLKVCIRFLHIYIYIVYTYDIYVSNYFHYIIDGPTHADRIAVLKSLDLYQPPKPRKKNNKKKRTSSISGDDSSSENESVSQKKPQPSKPKKQKEARSGEYLSIYAVVVCTNIYHIDEAPTKKLQRPDTKTNNKARSDEVDNQDGGKCVRIFM